MSLDKQGTDMGRNCRFGIVQKGDKGFKQLVKVLKEYTVGEGEIKEVKLIEKKAEVFISQDSPSIVRTLVIKTDNWEGRISDPFDPSKPIRELKNWVEDNFRKQLAYWMLGVLGVWLVANSYMLYLLNR